MKQRRRSEIHQLQNRGTYDILQAPGKPLAIKMFSQISKYLAHMASKSAQYYGKQKLRHKEVVLERWLEREKTGFEKIEMRSSSDWATSFQPLGSLASLVTELRVVIFPHSEGTCTSTIWT